MNLEKQVSPAFEWDLRELGPRPSEGGAVTFRFGLTGRRWGRQDRPVVLMHGWEGRPAQFANVVAPLVAADRQVIALDAPGHGASIDEQATVVQSAMALSEAAVEIRDLEAVVGHSIGASAVALALAQGLHAQRVVLISPTSGVEATLLRDVKVPVLIVHDRDDARVVRQVSGFLTGGLAFGKAA